MYTLSVSRLPIHQEDHKKVCFDYKMYKCFHVCTLLSASGLRMEKATCAYTSMNSPKVHTWTLTMYMRHFS